MKKQLIKLSVVRSCRSRGGDTLPSSRATPTIVHYIPATNSTVLRLRPLSFFQRAGGGSRCVGPVDQWVPASDLTFGVPANCVSFPQPAPGVVQVAFAPDHGIRDLSVRRTISPEALGRTRGPQRASHPRWSSMSFSPQTVAHLS